MKLSVESYVLTQKFGEQKAFELLKEAGFDAVDFSYYWDNECDRILGEGYLNYAGEIRKLLNENGLICNQAHAPFSIQYGEALDISNEKYLRLIRAMESASVLGAKNIIVHAIKPPKGVDVEAYNIDYYKGLVPYCEKFGICVSVENLFANDKKRRHIVGVLGTPEKLNRVVKSVDSKWVNACVDIGHASLTGYEPEDFIEGVDGEILKALHVQDNDYLSDRHVLPFTGELNWDAIMAALKEKNYEGELTLEIFNFLKKFPDALIPEVLRLAHSVGRYLIGE